jgi:hypothetical protein
LGGGSNKLAPLAMRMAGLWSVTLEITPSGASESESHDAVFNFCIPHD